MDISLAKFLYEFRHFLLSGRFLPLVLLGVLVASYFLYSFLNYWIFVFLFLLIIVIHFSIFWVSFSERIDGIKWLIHNEEMTDEQLREAYRRILKLENSVLWAFERCELELLKAYFFYSVGNHRRFSMLLDQNQSSILKHPKSVNEYRRLRALEYRVKGEFTEAKNELQQLLDRLEENQEVCAVLLNDIAAMEKKRGSLLSAEAYWEKAFEILRKRNSFIFHYSVIHNLLLLYAQQREYGKADTLLNAYSGLIEKDNSEKKIIEYINNLTYYARETGRKDIFNRVESLIKDAENLLDKKGHFIFSVSGLRANCDDKKFDIQELEKCFEKIEDIWQELSLQEKVRCVQEFWYILRCYHERHKYNRAFAMIHKLAERSLQLEKGIRKELKEIDPSLTSLRVFYIQAYIDVQTRMIFLESTSHQLNKNLIKKKMTRKIMLIDEKMHILEDSGNNIEFLDAIIQVMDELDSYFEHTKDIVLATSYDKKMLQYFDMAESKLEEGWRRIGMGSFMIALAWFSWRIKNDKTRAQKWLERFNDSGVSLQQFAPYLHDWYFKTKQWVCSPTVFNFQGASQSFLRLHTFFQKK